jgi:hypothetical protein
VRLLEALRIEGKAIAAEVSKSNLFTHMGDRGEFREKIIERFLRPFLPACYGVDSGEVFSADGQQSAQIDIVIYDAIFSTVLFRNGSRLLFPAESIYGSIEVKSNLSMEELDRACKNVASVKNLQRQDTDALDLLPHLRFPVGPSLGLTGAAGKSNPYLGTIFAYRGVDAKQVQLNLSTRVQTDDANKQILPDLVFVEDPGYMVLRCQSDGSIARIGDDFSRYAWVRLGAETLPMFFLTLNIALSGMRLRRPNLDALWGQLLQECIRQT